MARPDNGLLRIPKEDSIKNTENWHVAISDRAAVLLETCPVYDIKQYVTR